MTKRQLATNPGVIFVLALLLAAGVGGLLRSYLLDSQIFTDDEWHGFYYALGKSPGWLLTHFSIPGATCIPLNLYCWMLGATVGWTETLLRLPSWIFGMACVILCPLLARQIIGPVRASWLALLLAISPLLIFYSRVCRPYSAVAFFGFFALLLAAHWLQTGKLRSGLAFGGVGVLAVYFHLFGVVTVGAPFLAAIFLSVYAKYWAKCKVSGPVPILRHWLMISGCMVLVGAALVLPALVHSLRTTFFNIALAGNFQWQSLPRVLALISGTGQPVLIVIFWALVGVGAVDLCRRAPWFGGLLLSLFPLHVLALILSRPDSAQSAIMLVRYCIPLVPVSLLFVACGLQAILEFLAARIALRPALQTLATVSFSVLLVSAGPLPRCYVAPNNFTNHGAFQHAYGQIDWRRSFASDLMPANYPVMTRISVAEVSPFYGTLAKSPGSRPIIEYPMMIGDHFNPLYYYQHFHHRPVIVGYMTDVALSRGLAAGNVYGNTYVDQILSLIPKREQLRFHNLMSMEDLAGMAARQVEYIILHKRYEAELPKVSLPLPDVERLNLAYRSKLGSPAYEDANIVVFRLK